MCGLSKIFNFIVPLLVINISYAQKLDDNSFQLTGNIVGRDTGKITLIYTSNQNIRKSESTTLNNGSFYFTGALNVGSDAYLWTDEKNIIYEDSSVVRFLLEPGKATIVFNNNKALIKAGTAQKQKENFEQYKASLKTSKSFMYEEILKLYKAPDYNLIPAVTNKIDSLLKAIETINNTLATDLNYIKQHPTSLFSAFLLGTNMKKLVVDSLQIYFDYLASDIKASSEGYKLLSYIFPIASSNEFRKKNPLNGPEFYEAFSNIQSVHDINLKDSSGQSFSLKMFKGNYILIDFWASWCTPCLYNFPFYKKLSNEFKNEPIKFIAVSLDTDTLKWKNALGENKLSGFQFSEPLEYAGLLPIYTKLPKSLPHYILVDKTGTIVNYNLPPPSNPDLKTILKTILQKND